MKALIQATLISPINPGTGRVTPSSKGLVTLDIPHVLRIAHALPASRGSDGTHARILITSGEFDSYVQVPYAGWRVVEIDSDDETLVIDDRGRTVASFHGPLRDEAAALLGRLRSS